MVERGAQNAGVKTVFSKNDFQSGFCTQIYNEVTDFLAGL